MSNQLEFEPMLSNFLDEGFSNLKGKEKRKAKRTARKEKRVAKRAAKKGGAVATVEAPAAETAAETPAVPATPEAKTDATAVTDSTKTAETKDETKGSTAVASDDKGGDEGDGKILGMSKPVFFIGLAVVAVGGFFVVRSMMNKGGAQPATA